MIIIFYVQNIHKNCMYYCGASKTRIDMLEYWTNIVQYNQANTQIVLTIENPIYKMKKL